MKLENVLMINTVLFAIVALLHLWRAIGKREFILGTLSLPVWVSWVAVVVLLALVYANWSVLEKK